MDNPESIDNIGLSRGLIVEAFIKKLSVDSAIQLAAAEKSFQISAEMDGKMLSRYDTQKEDHAADGNMKLASSKRMKRRIEKFLEKEEVQESSEKSNLIKPGSIFLLEDILNGGNDWYFLSEMAGGNTITINATRVIGLNPESPLGAYSAGKGIGETIKYTVHGEEQKFKVINFI